MYIIIKKLILELIDQYYIFNVISYYIDLINIDNVTGILVEWDFPYLIHVQMYL